MWWFQPVQTRDRHPRTGNRLLFSLVLLTLSLGAVQPARAVQDEPVLLEETFDDPEQGVLPSIADDMTRAFYESGEYVIQKDRAQSGYIALATLPGTFDDTRVAVDVRLTGETGPSRMVVLACRQANSGRYDLRVFPGSGRFSLNRLDAGRLVEFAADESPALLRETATNRIELVCSGRTVIALINGVQVAAAQDSTLQLGTIYMGVYGAGLTAEARFDNLRVTEVAPSAAVGRYGDVLIEDRFDDPARAVLPRDETTFARRFYENGEYVIQKLEEASTNIAVATLPGMFADTTTVVEVRLTGEVGESHYATLSCRQSDLGRYQLNVYPGTGRVFLYRLNAGELETLTDVVSKAVERGTGVNHVTLTCSGRTIRATVNGEQVAVVEDDTFTSGVIRIGVYAPNSSAEARFASVGVIEDTSGVGAEVIAAPSCAVSADATYGYSRENPIQVGGGLWLGPARERVYLNTLRGPNGEALTYVRRGSIAVGETILDMYIISGLAQEVSLYVDMYHWNEPKAPLGFTCVSRIPLAPF